jgi:F-type H+-transporting ATPase subunit delta
MIVGSIARRYAKALFDLAVQADRVDVWAEGLVALKKAVEASPELRELLANPVYTKEQRQGLAARLAQALELDREPANLLALLADRNRLAYLSGVADTFHRLADEKLGRLRARVASAVPLAEAEVDALARKLAASSKAQVIVERVVDPALLGGVVAQIGSLVYDGSLRSQLEELRRSMKR